MALHILSNPVKENGRVDLSSSETGKLASPSKLVAMSFCLWGHHGISPWGRLMNSLALVHSLKLKQISKHCAKWGTPGGELHIEETHLVVIPRAEEDVISSGMPFNETNSSNMPKKFLLRTGNGFC